MIKKQKLEEKIREKNITKHELAEQLGIGRTSLYRKLTGGSEFNIKEVKDLTRILGLTQKEVRDIFLS